MTTFYEQYAQSCHSTANNSGLVFFFMRSGLLGFTALISK